MTLFHVVSPELVDVAALAKIRDDVLHRKGQFLELIMEDILSALYLRIQDNNNGKEAHQSLQCTINCLIHALKNSRWWGYI